MGKKTNDKLRLEAIKLGEEEAYEDIFNALDVYVDSYKDVVKNAAASEVGLLTIDALRTLEKLVNSLKQLKTAAEYLCGTTDEKSFNQKVCLYIDRFINKCKNVYSLFSGMQHQFEKCQFVLRKRIKDLLKNIRCESYIKADEFKMLQSKMNSVETSWNEFAKYFDDNLLSDEEESDDEW